MKRGGQRELPEWLADCRQILQELAGREDRAINRVRALAGQHRCVAARSVDDSPCRARGRRNMTWLRVVKSWRAAMNGLPSIDPHAEGLLAARTCLSWARMIPTPDVEDRQNMHQPRLSRQH